MSFVCIVVAVIRLCKLLLCDMQNVMVRCNKFFITLSFYILGDV